MRVLALLAMLLFLGTFAPVGLQRDPPLPAVSQVRFEPIALNEDAPHETRIGALRFLGGWAVSSNDYRFGGISALHVDGGRVLGVSDAGWLLRFTLPAAGGTGALEVGWIGEGPTGQGGGKEDRDAESLAVADGRIWIGYEQANSVWRYRLADWRAEASAAPPAMAGWDDNRGPEAMARLPDGRFLVFSEGPGGDSEVLLFDGDPAIHGTRSVRLRYRPPRGYRITDAAVLPDGSLLTLNRHINLLHGFSAKLTVVALPAIWANAVLEGKEIAAFEGPLAQGNLEGLSVVREGGRTLLWLASDDNYNPLQRTVLLKFALEARP
ncbi:MAG TPA: esterase-like activity of phytase family protein [Allosphingosinicella sp.]|nr:esterase-like activity of phytase family protein [Allosphingosinicella sp.]